jgi:hypothetical protein
LFDGGFDEKELTFGWNFANILAEISALFGGRWSRDLIQP